MCKRYYHADMISMTQESQEESKDKALMPSTIAIAEGSIIFLDDSVCTGLMKHCRRRPLIVLKVNPDTWMSSVTCVLTGSKGSMGGICLHLPTINSPEWIGGNSESYAYPWSLLSISPDNIRSIAGYLHPQLLQAIRKANAYHMGYSDEVPPYVNPFEVEYHTPKFVVRGGQREDFDYWKPLGLKEQVLSRERGEPLAVHYQVQATESSEEESPTEEVASTESEATLPEDLPEESKSKKRVRKPRSRSIDEIINEIPDDGIAVILSRNLTLASMAQAYNISRSSAQRMRDLIENRYVTAETVKRIRQKLGGVLRNVRYLSESEKVVMALYTDNEMVGVSQTVYKMSVGPVLEQYKINKSVINQTRARGGRDTADITMRLRQDLGLPVLRVTMPVSAS